MSLHQRIVYFLIIILQTPKLSLANTSFCVFFPPSAIESLNIAVRRICPEIPLKLIHSHNWGQNPIFYLNNTSDSTDWQTFPIKREAFAPRHGGFCFKDAANC